jgi:hypothetical protein
MSFIGKDINQAKNAILEAMQPKEDRPSEEAPSDVESTETLQIDEVAEVADTEESVEVETELESEADTADSGDVEAERLYKVKVQGEEREVSIEDLKTGYMMGADYSQKTAELAKSRDEINQKQESLSNKLQDAAALLKMEIDELESDEMKELKEFDPERFYEKKELLEGKVKKFNELKEEVNTHQQQLHEQHMKKEGELLLQALPEWVNQDVAKNESALVEKYWDSIGLSEEDRNGKAFQDHRFIVMSLQAAKYANIQSANPSSKKVTPKPKSTKPASANDLETAKAKKETTSRSRLRQTGNVRDAKAAIKDILNKRK